MNKTYFCSDAHFLHPNILKYEPQRVDETIKYIFETNKQLSVLQQLDEIRTRHEVDFTSNLYSGTACHALTEEYFKKLIIDSIFNETEVALRRDYINLILSCHDEMIIERWNRTITKNDTVYFLGDFAFKNRQQAEIIGRRLSGHKTIILGNHDGRKHNQDLSIKYDSVLESHFKACGFERVEFNPIILKGHFILSHEPLYYMNTSALYYNIFGHVHSNPEFKTETENSVCVCLDRYNYFPIQLDVYDKYQPNR